MCAIELQKTCVEILNLYYQTKKPLWKGCILSNANYEDNTISSRGLEEGWIGGAQEISKSLEPFCVIVQWYCVSNKSSKLMDGIIQRVKTDDDSEVSELQERSQADAECWWRNREV